MRSLLNSYLIVKRIFKYLIKLGFLNGIRTLYKFEIINEGSIKCFVPLLKQHVFLRAKTSDIKVFDQIFINEHYKLPIKINPRTIIDAGANIGLASLYFKSKYPSSKIIAIEPETSNYELLKLNTSENNEIICIKAALWNKITYLKIVNKDEDKFGFIVKESEENNADFGTVTLGEIIKQFLFESIDLLKVDIEGAEKEIFQDSSDWIEKVKTLIVEVHENINPGCTEIVYKAIKDLNFKEKIITTNILFYR